MWLDLDLEGELCSAEAVATEDARIAALTEVFRTDSADVRVGIGDDAAVLADGLVLSVDVCVEGTHFRRDFGPLEVLARRAAVGALSDLAAMGACPRALLSSLVVPGTLSDSELLALHRGLAAAATEVGAAVVGGNLAAGGELSLTTTVVGRSTRPLRRCGAKVGDAVYLSGPPGDAGLGLLALLAGRSSAFADRWLWPRAHIEEGLSLRGVASACVDVSDGLLRDLHHLCAASGVGAEIELAAIPRGGGFEAEARALAQDPDEVLLGSGEAYVLLFTAPASLTWATRIGTVVSEPGVFVRDRSGRRIARSPRGFDHFASGELTPVRG